MSKKSAGSHLPTRDMEKTRIWRRIHIRHGYGFTHSVLKQCCTHGRNHICRSGVTRCTTLHEIVWSSHLNHKTGQCSRFKATNREHYTWYSIENVKNTPNMCKYRLFKLSSHMQILQSQTLTGSFCCGHTAHAREFYRCMERFLGKNSNVDCTFLLESTVSGIMLKWSHTSIHNTNESM